MSECSQTGVVQMADLSVAAPEADAAGRRPQRRWPAISVVAAVAVAMLAGFGWRVLGEHPAISGGSNSSPGSSDFTLASDGVSDTKYVLHMVPERDYVVYISVANTGRFPFTVTGLAHSEIALYEPESTATFAVTSPATAGDPFNLPYDATATVKPGQQAAVRLVLKANRCWPMADGAYMVLTQLPVRVRQFGVTTDQKVPLLSLPLYVTDDLPANKLPADCR
jgi:hypothetical protein